MRNHRKAHTKEKEAKNPTTSSNNLNTVGGREKKKNRLIELGKRTQ